MLKQTIFLGLLSLVTIAAVGQSSSKNISFRNTVTDNAIEYPADMERNYDQLLTTWNKELKYGDKCDSYSDEAVTYDDSVYINRLYVLPTKMELVFNPVVRDYIQMYAGRRRNQVSYMLGEAKFYFPIFEEALDREGLPLELKYLPIIESALNPIARSRVGATGLWQFMLGTGKMYDLEINSLVDERCDPHKATDAAVKYLKDLYAIYGDWNLVIAAYNCGPGNVNKAIRRSGGQTDYWAIYPYLPKETRGYVPAFIAATYIMNYNSEHNICPAICNIPAGMDTLVIDKNIHFQQISDIVGVPVDDLRKMNPQFRKDIIPGEYKGYALNLPIQKLSVFIDNEDSIYMYRQQEFLTHRKVAGLDVIGGVGLSSNSLVHRVKKGETQSSIAQRYGVTIAQLRDWNGLSAKKLPIGMRLTIYKSAPQTDQKSGEINLASKNGSEAVSSSSSSVTKTPQAVTTYYKIRKGDTWAGIAKKNEVAIADLKKWNNTKNNQLIIGQQLKIQKIEYAAVEEAVKLPEPHLSVVESTSASGLIEDYFKKIEEDNSAQSLVRTISFNPNLLDHGTTDDTKIIYHKVKEGETISQIAANYNVSKKDIISWNKLSSSIAKVGQRLLIKLPEQKRSGEDTASNSLKGNNTL